jgi:hypothetical protein
VARASLPVGIPLFVTNATTGRTMPDELNRPFPSRDPACKKM